MSFYAAFNFRVNGLKKQKGELVSNDELAKLGDAKHLVVGSAEKALESEKAPEAPKEEPAHEDEQSSKPHKSGKKHKKGE